MKKIGVSVLLLLICTITVFAGGKDKLTLKEKIEKTGEVKVFFSVRDIYDKQDETKLQSSNMSAKTPIRTEMPAAFYSEEIQKGVLDNLNKGFEVGSFVKGEAAALVKSNNKKTEYIDFSKMPDGLVAIVDLSGIYTRTFAGGMNYTHRMEIQANLFFFEVTGGVAKKIKVNMGMGAFLGRATSKSKESDKMEELAFLETNFPPSDIYDEYVRTMGVNTQDFAARMLKKHNKVVSKRK